ncbi:MAG: T9SS type A sorting domain-containing protein [Tannerella sp.]|nr:T9SS type A sorting domain-containing protein [Tannerella sp.]
MQFYGYKHSGARKALIICVVSTLLHVPGVFAQISEGGIPPSFGYDQIPALRSAVKKTEVPVGFYIEDLREVDNWRAREGSPMPVSKLIQVDYTMDNSGSRTTLPGGERIWRLYLRAADAVAVMLYYKDFYIPEGGKLFIYSVDKSQLLGAYTKNTHLSGGLFATEFIGGDELVLEYVESEISDEKPRIHIDEIGYGYNTSALKTFCGITTRAVSGSCMVNINCEEGDAWQNEKKGVCHTIQRIGRANYICTGSLMNNTAEDFSPLILTARHCATYTETDKENKTIEHIADNSDMQQWVFYFNMEREECSNSSLTAVRKTMIGCSLLVNTGMKDGSDGMLLLLNDIIPENYDVFYNGWDRGDTPASSGACIHHPSGDYMKISTYGTPTKDYSFVSSEFTGYKNAHWNVIFQATANGFGITEGGSSGSPLYNENKLVVGTLTGGNSSCDYPRGLNIYGKMSYHWGKFQADSAHMDIWLDPTGSGVQTLAGRFRKMFKPAPLNVRAVNQGQSVSLAWDAPPGDEHPVFYNVYRNNQKIGDVSSVSFIDREPVVGSLVYSVSAVYSDGEESPFASTTISFVKFKAPTGLKVERIGMTDEIKLSWHAPVYEQTIYWGTMEVERVHWIGFGGNQSFYYGQKWSREEISPLGGKSIKAVQFIPVEKNTYEIFISQGSSSYRQNIESSSLRYESVNTIILDNPFVIDASGSLIVSIYISKVGDDHPAACDNGPAVDGKGNLCSFDGTYWEKFNINTPGKYDYNFIVSAIVSTESGKEAGGNNNGKILKHGVGVSEHSSETPGSNSGIATRFGIVKPRVSVLPFNENTVSLRSSMPAAFPEVTRYRIYRNGSVHRDNIDAAVTVHVEKTPLNTEYKFQVSAFYGNIESERSNEETIIVSVENINDVIDIYPTRFSNVITLKGYSSVTRIEAFSVSGKVCLVVNNPSEEIDTSSLSPGLYFFRIYGSNNKVLKVVRTIKTS